MRRQVRRKEEGRVAERKEAGYSQEEGKGQGRYCSTESNIYERLRADRYMCTKGSSRQL
jgi:hypothetical protein